MRSTVLCSSASKALIALLVTLVATTYAWADHEKVLHNFVNLPHGAYPQANLIADGGGNLYGTTPNGGRFGYGTVFELTPGENGKWQQKVLYGFSGGTDGASPVAGLVFDAAGNLYGTAAAGGTRGQNCYYSYNESCGVVFKLSLGAHGTWAESVLYSFAGYPTDGQNPVAGLAFDGSGNLYGTTESGGTYNEGTVFELTPGSNGTWTEKILYTFTGGTDGGTPLDSVILDSARNLYGTSEYGGDPNCNPDDNITSCGTVFELINNGNGTWTEAVLHTFRLNDGAYPSANLVFDAAGNLYGTTLDSPGFACDDGGCGIAFRLTHNSDGTWTERIIYNFEGGPDGAQPGVGLIIDGAGNLYGTTPYGGSDSCSEGCGTVFELTQKSKDNWIEKVIHHFSLPAHGENDGIQPMASVVLDQAGNLYGTARIGGDQSCDNVSFIGGCGTVFKLSPASGGNWTPSLLYTFTTSPFGSGPAAGVVPDSAGNLYGTTESGGIGNYGVAFELKKQPGGAWKEVILHSFVGDRDGAHPGAGLVSDSAGNLYGTTTNGGTRYFQCNGYESCGGTVFELSPDADGWKESVLYRFGENSNKGLTIPMAGLVLDSTGNLYGTTSELGITNCGSYGCGTVYKLSPSETGEWRIEFLYRFRGGTDGWDPVSPLVLDQAGSMYGTTCEGGANGEGTVFKLTQTLGGRWAETVLYSFQGPKNGDGSCPFAGVVFDRDGNLYGTTFEGGSSKCYNGGCGIVFRLSPSGLSLWKETVLHTFLGGFDGSNPESSLTFDQEGNLYGTAPDDGPYYGGGAVFKLSRGSDGTWRFDVLRHFKNAAKKGFCPVGPLIFDAAGDIYGAASCGGTDGGGAVFELLPDSDGQWVDDLLPVGF